jgi:Holliday junction resolvase RusA-like endonuclease
MIVLDLNPVKLPRVNERYNKNFSLRSVYKDRKAHLSWAIREQAGNVKIDPPYAVKIDVGTHLDIDSYVKPLMDALQDTKIIDNDKNILYLEITKEPLKRNQDNWIKVEVISEKA